MNDLAKAFKENGMTSELFNALPCGILVISEDGTVLRLNNVIEQIFGVKSAELTGESFGKAFRCVNSCEDEKECGPDSGCEDCEVRRLAIHKESRRSNGINV